MQEVQAGFPEEVGFGEGFKDEWNWPQSACSHMWIYCQSALFPKGSNCAFVSPISVTEDAQGLVLIDRQRKEAFP